MRLTTSLCSRAISRVQAATRGHLGGYIVGGDPHSWCQPVWDWLLRQERPGSVLDLGCGEGHSTRYFHEQGCRVLGVDGMPEAVANFQVPGRIALHDFRDGPFRSAEKFDLLWSCEFLEHITETDLPNVLATLRVVDGMLAITHALPGQPGHHHVNCRPDPYWIEVMERCGFVCSVSRTVAARVITLRNPSCGYYFGRSGLIFQRCTAAGNAPELDYQRIIQLGARPSRQARLKHLMIRAGVRMRLAVRRYDPAVAK